jgi:hypothetical protein
LSAQVLGIFGLTVRICYNVTLSDDSEEEEETPAQDQKFLAFVAPHEDEEDSRSFYSESVSLCWLHSIDKITIM